MYMLLRILLQVVVGLLYSILDIMYALLAYEFICVSNLWKFVLFKSFKEFGGSEVSFVV